MKVLHTADWHIGKILHKQPLRDELIMFFEWLVELIKTENIDLLLISGDIFDISNPASIDRQLYYGFLSQLIGMQVKVIVTGGNHDSIGVLNAPQGILESLNITVVGGAKENIEDELIEVRNENNELALVVAATPFLRDRDLRSRLIDSQYPNRVDAIRVGIKNHYAQLATVCKEKYSDVVTIAMGHLFTKGVSTSDSERDIHVGNAAAVDHSVFGEAFDYVALGHIHRPQRVEKNPFIRYSGSPIALSFSEREDNKSIVIITLNEKKIETPVVVPIPKFRALKKISGSLSKVTEALTEFKPNFALKSLVEIEVMEDVRNAQILSDVDDLVSTYSTNEDFAIIKARTLFKETDIDSSSLFKDGEEIGDLKPIDVFKKLLEHQEIEDETQAILKEAFQEILESVIQSK